MNTTGTETCKWCGCLHQNQACSLVKRIDFYQDGTIKRVEFKSYGDKAHSYHCNICGGEVDLSAATEPTAGWARGRGVRTDRNG